MKTHSLISVSVVLFAGYQPVQIAAGKRSFPNQVISFFSQFNFPYCQNNSHENGHQIFFNNTTGNLMIHVQQSCKKKNHLQTCISIPRSFSSSYFFWHEKLKLLSAIFIQFLFFNQIIAQNYEKCLLFHLKSFSFSRYSNFCISVLPLFSAC